MAESSDRDELKKRLEQAKRIAGSVLDPLTKERLTRLVQELEEQLRLLSCCRFDGHQDWVFHTAGGRSCRDGSSVESSRSRRSS